MRRFVLTLHLCLVLVSTLLLHAQDFTTLANFSGGNGYTPSSPLTSGDDGNLYGLTAEGGEYGAGILYRVNPSGTLNVGPSFSSGVGGDGPSGRLLLAPIWDEAFYGTSMGESNGYGGLFHVGMEGFEDLGGLCQGCHPEAGLIRGADGSLYGTSATGGTGACSGGCGFVFKSYGVYSPNTIHQFNGSDGANPRGELLQASDGNLYGTTVNGGNGNCQSGCGTIFRVSPSGDFKSLYKFCSQSNCPDGANPYGALVQGSDGALYGTTSAGGNVGVNCWATGCGTVFKITSGWQADHALQLLC